MKPQKKKRVNTLSYELLPITKKVHHINSKNDKQLSKPKFDHLDNPCESILTTGKLSEGFNKEENKDDFNSYYLLLSSLGIHHDSKDNTPNLSNPSQFFPKELLNPKVDCPVSSKTVTSPSTHVCYEQDSCNISKFSPFLDSSSKFSSKPCSNKTSKFSTSDLCPDDTCTFKDGFSSFDFELTSKEASSLKEKLRFSSTLDHSNNNRKFSKPKTFEEELLENSLSVTSQIPSSHLLETQDLSYQKNKTSELNIISPPGFQPFFSEIDPKSPCLKRLYELLDKPIYSLQIKNNLIIPKDIPFISPEIKTNLKDKSTNKIKLKSEIDFEDPFYSLNNFAHFLFAYIDILYPQQDEKSSNLIYQICTLHLVNHIFNCRSMVIKNNLIIENSTNFGNKNPHVALPFDNSIESKTDNTLQDQGFTRPRILIISPLRSLAKRFIDLIIHFSTQTSTTIMHRKRYESEFGSGEQEKSSTDDVLETQEKPLDYINLFGGNPDDNFVFGIRFSNKRLNLFSPLYCSDIIVASPLGLRLAIKSENDKNYDYDFLSSIEILLADRLDVIRMQNWKFMKDIWKVLNKPPLKHTDFDIRRVRRLNIEDMAICFRQTILLSNGNHFYFSSLLNQSANFRGALKLWSASKGKSLLTLNQLGIKQVFQKVSCSEFQMINDNMLSFFEKLLSKKLLDSIAKYLIILPSYIEYLRLVKLFRDNQIDFLSCHEYSSNKSLSTSRQKFFHSAKESPTFLITTDRFLFYRRYILRGADCVIFWGPPNRVTYEESYKSLNSYNVDYLYCFYTEYHSDNLEQIVGLERAHKLLTALDLQLTVYN